MPKQVRRSAPRKTLPAASGAHDGETEQRILAAARIVFIRRGTAGARMQEIAREAGVNQALLHYYFRSKQRLSDAVFQQVAAGLFPTLIVTLGSEASLDEKIDRLVALYLDALTRSPFLPGYLLSEMHHHPERLPRLFASAAGVNPAKVIPQLLEKLGKQIDAAAGAHSVRRVAPEQFVINIISLCVFPFAARPLLGVAFGMDDARFARFIEQRKTELPAFVRNALRP
jgi:TetR/AcrR family transcriptional regulator